IANAKSLMVAITGAEKRKVLEAAIKQGASSAYPIGRVLAETELPVDVHWLE
ncbi:MAG TPA: 6-phosphogluconolactonase, partial [Sphingomonas sp.]|nr:6-phosphogluconolactonase [Sphingomonas sp.]